MIYRKLSVLITRISSNCSSSASWSCSGEPRHHSAFWLLLLWLWCCAAALLWCHHYATARVLLLDHRGPSVVAEPAEPSRLTTQSPPIQSSDNTSRKPCTLHPTPRRSLTQLCYSGSSRHASPHSPAPRIGIRPELEDPSEGSKIQSGRSDFSTEHGDGALLPSAGGRGAAKSKRALLQSPNISQVVCSVCRNSRF